MIVVRVELWSKRTGEKTELARMEICNDGTSAGAFRHYVGRVFRGRSKAALDRGVVQTPGHVRDWPAERLHVWNLVATMLTRMGYGRNGPGENA